MPTARPVDELAAFIDASPTPYHAVAMAASLLDAAGFTALERSGSWGSEASGPSYVVRDGALVAWGPAGGAGAAAPLRIIGAHTDSPNLRIRPRPDRSAAGFRQLAVEVYGGALLNSWLDRDLGLAGRVAVRGGRTGVEHVPFRSAGAVMRVPQLAIHLDRDISSTGLLLNRQQHLTPVWGTDDLAAPDFRSWLAEQVGVASADVLAWDAMAFDVQGSATLGVDGELLAAPRLDDLACCFGAIRALADRAVVADQGDSDHPSHVAVVVLSDNEEIGSVTATGADGDWLAQVLERRAVSLGGDREGVLRSLARSMLLSADMAHATHPNYPDRHEPGHQIRAGGGPVIKHNVNARYATDSRGAATFRLACESVAVPVQDYSHRGDLPCGSTIGPLTAARLAVDTVDVGLPMLSMHSARELMAAADVAPMLDAFAAWFTTSAEF